MGLDAGLRVRSPQRLKKERPESSSSPSTTTSAPTSTSAPASTSTPASPSTTGGGTTSPRPTPATAAVGFRQFNADLGIDHRRRLIEAELAAPPAAQGFTVDSVDALESVDTHEDVAAAREAYEALSDEDELRQRLEDEPDLTEWNDTELHALAAVSIDHPEHAELIGDAVAETIEELDELSDLPEHAGLQFLVEQHVVEGTHYSARAHLGDLVQDELSAEFDAATEGARGDDELEDALADFANSTETLITHYPGLFPIIEDRFGDVFEEKAERIQDIQRADDPWYADVNHFVTDGIRGGARWLADQVFPLPSSGGGRVSSLIPGSDFLNSPTGQALQQLGIGAALSGRGLIEGPAQVVTDPVGTAEALVEIVRDPGLLLEGYRQVAEEYGPGPAVANAGFDLLLGITSAQVGASALGPVSRGSALTRLVPDRVRRLIDADFRVVDDLRRIDGFDALPSNLQDLAIRASQRLPDGQVVARIIDTPGFRALDAADQDRLLRLAGSDDPYLGGPARAQLDALLSSDDFARLPNGDQAARLVRYLDDQEGFSGLAPDGTYRPRYEWSAGEPDVVSYPFDNGGGQVALRQTLTIDGQSIDVVGVVGEGTIPDLTRVANALASLPPEARRTISRIVIEPEANSLDAVSGSTTLADAAVDGTVRIFPGADDLSFDQFTDVLVHESAHTLANDRFAPPRYNAAGEVVFEGAEWDRWRAAVDSDGLRASEYAGATIGEDFAETYRLYISSRGTPWAHELRALMPERFAILDELTAGGTNG